MRVVQAAVRTLADLAIASGLGGEDSQQAVRAMVEVGRRKDGELQLVAGECFVQLCRASNGTLQNLLDLWDAEYVDHAQSSHRAAVACWLFVVVHELGPTLTQRQRQQAVGAFLKLLVEKADLPRECAMRGLAALAEACEDELEERRLAQAVVRLLGGASSVLHPTDAASEDRMMGRDGDGNAPERDSRSGTTSSQSGQSGNVAATNANSASTSTDATQGTQAGQQVGSDTTPTSESSAMSRLVASAPHLLVIASLCQDLGKLTLVFPLLRLAATHPLWSTDIGTNLVDPEVDEVGARSALDQFNSRLAPELFRLVHDSAPIVARFAKRLWLVCFANSDIVFSMFDVLLLAQVKDLSGRHSKTRAAAALALSDLLRGSFATTAQSRASMDAHFREGRLMEHFTAVWKAGLKAADDMTEMVRQAASPLVRAIGKMTLTMCSPEERGEEAARRAVGVALPFLLRDGILSSSKDARKVCLGLLVEIVKRGKRAILPLIGEVVEVLLEALSSHEDASLSYASFHTDEGTGALGLSHEQLETARVQHALTSPVMAAVNESLAEFARAFAEDPAAWIAAGMDIVKRIAELLRGGVGLATLACTASVVVTLSAERGMIIPDSGDHLLSAVASELLRSLELKLNDPSNAVRRRCAAAGALVARHAVKRGGVVQQWTQRAVADMYFNFTTSGSSVSKRSTAAYAAGELVRQGAEALEAHPAAREIVVVTSFIGRLDEDKGVADAFDTVWATLVHSNAEGVRAHGPALLQGAKRAIEYQVWQFRKQGAEACAVVADHAAGAVFVEVLEFLIQVGLPGSAWTGKEKLLEALVRVARAVRAGHQGPGARDLASGVDALVSSCIDAVVEQCERPSRRLSYTRGAFHCLGELVDLENDALKSRVFVHLVSHVDFEALGKWEVDVEAGITVADVQSAALDAVAKSWPLEVVLLPGAGAGGEAGTDAAIAMEHKALSTVLRVGFAPGAQWQLLLAGLHATRAFLRCASADMKRRCRAEDVTSILGEVGRALEIGALRPLVLVAAMENLQTLRPLLKHRSLSALMPDAVALVRVHVLPLRKGNKDVQVRMLAEHVGAAFGSG